jgi:hypothetical protein
MPSVTTELAQPIAARRSSSRDGKLSLRGGAVAFRPLASASQRFSQLSVQRSPSVTRSPITSMRVTLYAFGGRTIGVCPSVFYARRNGNDR